MAPLHSATPQLNPPWVVSAQPDLSFYLLEFSLERPLRNPERRKPALSKGCILSLLLASEASPPCPRVICVLVSCMYVLLPLLDYELQHQDVPSSTASKY